MSTDAYHIILTSQPESAVIALNEVQKLDPAARPVGRLSADARLVSLPGGYLSFLQPLKKARLIFARHMFPVQYSGVLAEDTSVLPLLSLDSPFRDRPFSVQLRTEPRDGALFARALAFALKTEEALLARGFIKNDKSPEWVVSLFVCGDTLYAGVSDCADNLSAWNGGAARYKKDEGHISRAEFKLLEAFEVFGYTPPVSGSALDLGAAPGGWTRALLERGLSVTAIDPAALHESILQHPRLTHVRDIAQRFHPGGKQYDLMVNDMRMDIADSCRIMLDFEPLLRPDGKALMTLKLSPGQWYQKTARALAMLEKKYRVLSARQLFHNRDEVTVFFTKNT